MAHRKPHAIAIPYPYQGHVTPMVNLSIKLASSGFTVTFVQTEFIHLSISRALQIDNDLEFDLFDQARKQDPSLLDNIRYTKIYDGFPLEFDRDFNFDLYWETMFRDFPGRVEQVIEKIIGDDYNDNDGDEKSRANFFLIADTFWSWPSMIAKKYKLVHVSLWTEPGLVFAVNYHLDLLRQNGHFPWKGIGEDIINYIPSVPSISTRDLMTYIQQPHEIGMLMLIQVVIKGFEQVKEADFILCNTVLELESETITYLNQKHPTYAIGPINFYPESANTTISKSLWSETDCKEWLESKPQNSVLYVSFGSIAQTTKDEIAELSYGLVESGVNFIWVLRPGIVVEDRKDGNNDKDQTTSLLPIGFEDSIKDRGLIVPWCSQNMVLSSPACGGFLTHCGWNSTLESMWYGVPMICYPFLVDQPTNRKLVVEDWKIGINLCDGERVEKDEVARKIKSLMISGDEEAMEMRKEIKKVSEIMHDALGSDGSSQRSFDQFVEDLKQKLYC